MTESSEPHAGSASRPIVALESTRDDPRRALQRALESAEFTRFVPRGADVALKVNLGWNGFVPGAITSPLVVELLIQEIAGHVGKIFVVESDQALEDVELAFQRSGMARVCRLTGATWLNLTRSPSELVECPENTVLKRIAVPKVLREALLITVPVMKTHAKTLLTGALKNQWGCLPKDRHRHHPVLDQALADLNRVIRPTFAVMDGTIGLEGNGPKSGRPRVADRILCSADPVALDTVQALSMGIDPAAVGHLQTCAARGIGCNEPSRIDVRGLDPIRDSVPFAPARHNLVSRVEVALRKSPLAELVFDSALFDYCLLAARGYYRLWALRNAAAYWALACRHPVYGAQWRTAQREAARAPP